MLMLGVFGKDDSQLQPLKLSLSLSIISNLYIIFVLAKVDKLAKFYVKMWNR